MGRVALERAAITQQRQTHAVALLGEPPCRNETVAAIVAGAGEHQDARADADHAAGRVRDCRAGAFHQIE